MLVQLTPDNFHVNSVDKTLCLGARYLKHCFVMFMNDSCVYCKDVYPAFKALSNSPNINCMFAVMNVELDDRKILTMSKYTSTPIEYVPYMIMYVDGRPHSQFHPNEQYPDRSFHPMRIFVHDVTSSSSMKNGMAIKRREDVGNTTGDNNNNVNGSSNKKMKTSHESSDRPAYSLGIPISSDNDRRRGGRCYLLAKDAYSIK